MRFRVLRLRLRAISHDLPLRYFSSRQSTADEMPLIMPLLILIARWHYFCRYFCHKFRLLPDAGALATPPKHRFTTTIPAHIS